MNIGMLWYATGTAPLADKVSQAADFYAAKMGQPATVCHVHPSMLPPDGAPLTVGTVRVRADKTVLRNHLWVGVEQETP